MTEWGGAAFSVTCSACRAEALQTKTKPAEACSTVAHRWRQRYYEFAECIEMGEASKPHRDWVFITLDKLARLPLKQPWNCGALAS